MSEINQFLRYDGEKVLEFVAAARSDEARRCAADVCEFCREGNEPERQENFWTHGDGDEFCDAGDIHERLHRESQKGGNHEKT